MKRFYVIAMFVFALSLWAPIAGADVLAQWTPTAPADGQSNASNQPQKLKSKAEHLEVSSLSHSSDETASNEATVWPNKANPKFDAGDYVTFDITPQDKQTVSVSKIDFDYTSYDAANNDKGYTVTVRSSQDNFAADVATVTVKNEADGTFVLDLSKLKPLTAKTTFRLYFIDNSAGEDSWADLAVGANDGMRVEGKVEASK